MKRHIARKRFGQNFLIDDTVIDRIVAKVAPQKGQNIVEIGPGLGALTDKLIQSSDFITVIELDRDLIVRLEQRFSEQQIKIYSADVLNFNFDDLTAPIRVIGNLPYNISTPLLFKLADYDYCIEDMVFMLQKEVVMRMVSPPGSKEYGRLSVMLQYHFEMQHEFDVFPESFDPMPSIISSIVRLKPLGTRKKIAQNEQHFADLVRIAFTQRRKTLRNALAKFVSSDVFSALNIDPSLRPECLSVEDYIRLADASVV